MRFLHLSDLHLGKTVNKFSMIEDQKYILNQIIDIAADKKNDISAVIIAGDIYDTGIPPVGAVELFDDFLTKLVKLGLKIFIIAGNHDSAERISFASKIMEGSGVYVAPVYNGNVEPVVLKNPNENLTVNVFLLPFIKPANVKAVFPEEAEKILNYTDGCKLAIEKMNVLPSSDEVKNIIVTHQFVTGAEIFDSEDLSVGGTDNVDGSVFEQFDYVALGHLHKSQKVGRDTIRYSGTPLKYSVKEADHKKSVTVVDIKNGKKIEIFEIPLKPLRDIVLIRGNYNELMSKSFYEKLNLDDYYKVTLTDEIEIPEGLSRLRTVYPNIMIMEYDNTRTQNAGMSDFEMVKGVKSIDPLIAFEDFFELQNGRKMSMEQQSFVKELIDDIFVSEK